MKIHMTYEKLSNSKDMTAKHILPFHRFAGILFNFENDMKRLI